MNPKLSSEAEGVEQLVIRTPPFRLVTVRGVRARPGVDLDRPRALDAQDDEARFGHGNR